MKHPNVLPIEDIEPALVPLIPICTELRVPSGYIDNFYVTPSGDIVIAETKLWRNPEARREVIGQILDYAKDLSRWSYEDLDRAAGAAQNRTTDAPKPAQGLWAAVQGIGVPDLDEAPFVDAISRNLRRGRFLLLVVGDGIQEGAEGLTEFLQQHAGLHFTLAVIELAIFELSEGYLVQPRISLRTTNIDRGIVSVDEGRVSIRPASPISDSGPTGKRVTISEERFYEELAANHPDAVIRLKAFLERLAELGVTDEFGKQSLILRWRPDSHRAWNLGAIQTDGKVWTELLHQQTDTVGLLDLSQQYVQQLAEIVPGAYVKKTSAKSWHVDKDGTYVLVTALLAHANEWYDAIRRFTVRATETLSRLD
jgi:hypothetical protein